MFASPLQYAVVASGATVTNPIDVTGLDRIGAFAPVVTSCQMFLQAAVDSGGPFYRVAPYVPGSVVAWSVGPGSQAAVFDAVAPFTHVRFEYSAAQADTRTLTVISDRRRYG